MRMASLWCTASGAGVVVHLPAPTVLGPCLRSSSGYASTASPAIMSTRTAGSRRAATSAKAPATVQGTASVTSPPPAVLPPGTGDRQGGAFAARTATSRPLARCRAAPAPLAGRLRCPQSAHRSLRGGRLAATMRQRRNSRRGRPSRRFSRQRLLHEGTRRHGLHRPLHLRPATPPSYSSSRGPRSSTRWSPPSHRLPWWPWWAGTVPQSLRLMFVASSCPSTTCQQTRSRYVAMPLRISS